MSPAWAAEAPTAQAAEIAGGIATPGPTAAAPEPSPRYVLEIVPRAPGLALNHVVTLLANGTPLDIYPDIPFTVEVIPGVAMRLELPSGVPLCWDAPSTAFASLDEDCRGCTLRLTQQEFAPEESTSGGGAVFTAHLELFLTAEARAPGIRLPAQGGTLQAGESFRHEITFTNSALAPQEVELRYLPDEVRFALENAPNAGYDYRLPDGTLCWLLTLPAATWDAQGKVIPGEQTIAFDRIALPLPADLGFARASEGWQLLWRGTSRNGYWRAEVVAPRIQADLSADAETACVGDLLTFTVRLTNQGGAEKRLIISTVLPRGFRFQPGGVIRSGGAVQPGGAALPGETGESDGSGQSVGGIVAAPEVVGDMLLWKLGVPAARRGYGGDAEPAKVELQYALRVEDNALDESEGFRLMDFGGWVDGAKLPPVQIMLLAARIAVKQSLSTQSAGSGEIVTLRTVFENHGGAAGKVIWAQTLPEGLTYLPGASDALDPPKQEKGQLVWEVEVPPAELVGGALSRPGVTERAVQLQVAESAAEDTPGGLRTLLIPAMVGDDALPVQSLDILCPDLTVQMLAERATLAPGSLCLMKLQVSNLGPAGAQVVLEADMPEGFAAAEYKRKAREPEPTLEGRTLRWTLDVPPAQEGKPSVIEVVYPLSVGPLEEDEERRTVVHSARYAIAQGQPRSAAAEIVISEKVPLDLHTGEVWMLAAVTASLLCALVVFLLVVVRKVRE